MKTKIFIFAGLFLPSKKSVGPSKSILNFISNLNNEYDFYIIAEYDTKDKLLFNSNTLDEKKWIQAEMYKIIYFKKNLLLPIKIRRIQKKINPEIVYFNSFFSFSWTFIPIILSKKINKRIIAPRGNFSGGALSLKSYKKKAYLWFFNFYIHNKYIINWHLTDNKEIAELNNAIANVDNYVVARNITIDPNYMSKKKKQKSTIDLIYFGRVSPKNNLKYTLEVLNEVKGNYKFTFYGPIENLIYYKTIQDIINKNNINAHYGGIIDSKDIYNVISNYDLLVFPTIGENHSHTILESLSIGLPVLISDNTPWNDVNGNGGYVCNLKEQKKFVSIISELIEKDQTFWSELRNDAKKFFNHKLSVKKILKEYNRLFQDD